MDKARYKKMSGTWQTSNWSEGNQEGNGGVESVVTLPDGGQGVEGLRISLPRACKHAKYLANAK
jgi:hypothetical protein